MSGCRLAALAVLVGMLPGVAAWPARALDMVETPFFAARVSKGEMPPVAERLPRTPIVVDLVAKGRTVGEPGGQIVSLAVRARDIRYFSASEYARLVGYDENLKLTPDIVEKVDVGDDKTFVFTLRDGHKWSDGQPFTTEDFRFYWEDIANNKDVTPSGPLDFMIVDGRPPKVEIVDARTIRYSWDKPNPRFLPGLAQARDPLIYRPAHYLKQFHAKYTPKAKLDEEAKKQKLRSWAAMLNRMDDMFDNSNPNIPTLQPWRIVTAAPANRFIFERNAYYHRVDTAGHQLPYIDTVAFDISAAGLMAAKANSGDVDMLFRGISMGDIPILKEGERAKHYRTLLWPYARGSELALYPNLNVTDPVWRTLNRDLRFRKALSLSIDRPMLNNALLFGLGTVGNDTIVPESPLYRAEFKSLNAGFDPGEASRLLDEIGLTQRNGAGIRLLPDGRELEIIVETDGEGGMVVDGLTLITEFWRDIGVKLFVKPQDRTILRNRTYAGMTVMVAAQGLDVALATADMPPTELAPRHQDNYAWPKWGQYVETKGTSGERCDIPEAQRLSELYEQWMSTADKAEQGRIWDEMLMNHAQNLWSIGTVAGALQPIVVKDTVRNVPTKAVYSYEPTSMLGIYRIDEFYQAKPSGKEAWMPPSRPRDATRAAAETTGATDETAKADGATTQPAGPLPQRRSASAEVAAP